MLTKLIKTIKPMEINRNGIQDDMDIQHSHLRNKLLFNSQIQDNKYIEVFKKLVLQDGNNLI